MKLRVRRNSPFDIFCRYQVVKIRKIYSYWLTNNEKAQFANLNNPPKKEEALELMDQSVKEKIVALSPSTIQDIQSQIKALLKSGDVSKAWCIAIQLP